MIKKIVMVIFTVLMTVSFVTQANADNTTSASGQEYVKVGAAGAQFLKIGVGGRGNGLGAACTSVINDLTSLHWNPAGIADVHSIQGHFAYTQWFADYSHNFAAFSLPVSEDFTAAFQLISFGTDNVEVTTLVNPEGTGTYYAISDFALGASFGGRLTEQFTFGVSAKYITNSFADVDASGFAFDIGTLYKTGIQGITLGFAILNLGTRMNYSGQDLNATYRPISEMDAMPVDVQILTSSYSMPLTFRAGISSEVYNYDVHKVLVAADFVTYSDVAEQYSLGAEYTWDEMLSVRGGYRIGHDQMGLSGGIGINYLIGASALARMDYFLSPTKDMGMIHGLSLTVGLQ